MGKTEICSLCQEVRTDTFKRDKFGNYFPVCIDCILEVEEIDHKGNGGIVIVFESHLDKNDFLKKELC